MAAIWKNWKYQPQLWYDLRYEKIVPNHAMNDNFFGDDVIDDITWWPKSHSPYKCLGEARGASCKGNISSIGTDLEIFFLGYTCLKKI